jgi:hypothetical protein
MVKEKRECRGRQQQQNIVFDCLVFSSSDSRKTLEEYLLICSHSFSLTSFLIFFLQSIKKTS